MSRLAFAARFRALVGDTPLEVERGVRSVKILERDLSPSLALHQPKARFALHNPLLGFPGENVKFCTLGHSERIDETSTLRYLHFYQVDKTCFFRRHAERLSPTLRRHEKHSPGFLLNLHFSRVPASAYLARRYRLAYKSCPILRGGLLAIRFAFRAPSRCMTLSFGL